MRKSIVNGRCQQMQEKFCRAHCRQHAGRLWGPAGSYLLVCIFDIPVVRFRGRQVVLVKFLIEIQLLRSFESAAQPGKRPGMRAMRDAVAKRRVSAPGKMTRSYLWRQRSSSEKRERFEKVTMGPSGLFFLVFHFQ